MVAAKVVAGLMLLCALATGGCESDHTLTTDATPVDLFAPTGMLVHPIFTQITDLNHSGKPNGIEAQLEFTDQFGDPTKATGKVLFELFDYRRESPDPRGKRFGQWVGSLTTPADQREKWNTTLRTYRFELTDPSISPTQSYVLSATFELSSGGRFFDRIVLPAHPAEKPEKKEPGLGVE
jgi:hypothetical protein